MLETLSEGKPSYCFVSLHFLLSIFCCVKPNDRLVDGPSQQELLTCAQWNDGVNRKAGHYSHARSSPPAISSVSLLCLPLPHLGLSLTNPLTSHVDVDLMA